MPALARFLLLAGALLLSGCETLSYYGKGMAGQWRFYGAREPIREVLARGELDAEQQQRLALVPQIRRFARDELKLPIKGQYRDYVHLPEGSLVWNVFAAPELSLEAHRWCYLFGSLCVEYRGYFRRADAESYAEQFLRRGYDVHIGEVAAFSSLGLFDDPVTSVLLAYPDDLLAAVLFHELAHVALYVKDDTAFNESFAEAVAEEGLRRWRRAQGRGHEEDRVAKLHAQQAVMIDTALATRERLAALYASGEPVDILRARKQEILAEAAGDYAARCTASGAGCGYAPWFADINNAKLNAVATYRHWVPAFTALLRAGETGGQPADMQGFLKTARELARLPRAQRDAILRALMPPAAPGIAADGAAREDTTP